MAYEIPRQYYTGALKREAVRRVRDEGKTIDHVCEELGLSPLRLTEWLAADHPLGVIDTVPEPVSVPLNVTRPMIRDFPDAAQSIIN